jgi:hypothetical protein
MKAIDFGAALLLGTLAASTAQAGEYLDAKISFPFADDNVLRGAGEDRQSSPGIYIGGSPSPSIDRILPDRYDSFMHIGLYKMLDLSEVFVPEAALYLKLDIAKGTIRDDASYIRLNFVWDRHTDESQASPGIGQKDLKPTLGLGDSVFLELFPIDADRLRLGFHYEVTWGGTDIFPRNFRTTPAPAARVGVDIGEFYAFAGIKTALIKSAVEAKLANAEGNETLFVERTFYGGLFGAGVELGVDGLWLEANGGVFEKGTNNKAEVLGKPIIAAGGSAMLSFSRGLPIGRRLDLNLFRADPVRFDLTETEPYGGPVSFRVAGEYTLLTQTLADFDFTGSTKNELSMAGFASAAVKAGGARVLLDGGFRDLTFITADVPGFFPYSALPEAAEVTPEFSAVLSFDYLFQTVGLTPYVSVGFQMPATYKGSLPAGQNNSQVSQGVQHVVVRGDEPGDWDILPEGEEVMPVLSTLGGLRWTYEDTFAALFQLDYSYDPDRAQIRKDENGIGRRVFVDPNRLGVSLLASVRF